MKKTITKSDFRDAFIHMGRKENFSYNGSDALFDYLEEIDENMELDIIAICCDFTEYTTKEAAAEAYGTVAAELDDKTIVIVFDGGVIVQNF